MIYEGTFTGSFDGKKSVWYGTYKMKGTLSVTIDNKGALTGTYSGKETRPWRSSKKLSGTIQGYVTDAGVMIGGTSGAGGFNGQLTRSENKITGKGPCFAYLDGETLKGDWDISGDALLTGVSAPGEDESKLKSH